MGMMEGILKGVGQSFKETTARMAEENQRQAMLESRVYEALLSSDHPEVQELALQGMTEIASGKGGKKKGLMGFLGKEQPSPILASMGDLFSGGKSVQAPKGAPTGETPAGVPFEEESPPSAAMVPETGADLGGEQERRGLYKSQAEKAGETVEAEMGAKIEQLRSLGASDEEIRAALTGQATGRPGVDFQTIVDPQSGKNFIVAVDDATGQVVKVVGEAPPSDRAAPRPITVSPGSTLVDPETGEKIFQAPPRPKEPGEDPLYTQAKRTQRALESHIDSLGFGFTTMTDDERGVFLDEFVQKYGGWTNHGEYMQALAGGGAGGAPPSAGAFDINQVPEQYRRFMEPTTGAPSQEAEQRIQIIIEKLRAYKADPENSPPLDTHEVEFAQFYEQYFLGRK